MFGTDDVLPRLNVSVTASDGVTLEALTETALSKKWAEHEVDLLHGPGTYEKLPFYDHHKFDAAAHKEILRRACEEGVDQLHRRGH